MYFIAHLARRNANLLNHTKSHIHVNNREKINIAVCIHTIFRGCMYKQMNLSLFYAYLPIYTVNRLYDMNAQRFMKGLIQSIHLYKVFLS